jgi:hypothetical protein
VGCNDKLSGCHSKKVSPISIQREENVQIAGEVAGMLPTQYAFVTVTDSAGRQVAHSQTTYAPPHYWIINVDPGVYRVSMTPGIGNYIFVPSHIDIDTGEGFDGNPLIFWAQPQ